MPLPCRTCTVALAGLAIHAAALAQQPVWQPMPGPGDVPASLAQTTYDAWRHRCVAVDASQLVEFDRARWQLRGGGTGFDHSAVAFDHARGVAVAFGGGMPFVADAGTREWNGSTWTLRALPVSPPGRSRAAMAFDRLRSRLVLFGGQNAVSQKLSDTWEYDGTTWTQVATTGGPAARSLHAMTFDPQRGVVVLYGGLTTAWTNETWEWNGSTWTQHGGGPTQAPQVLAYDETRGRCVLLGLLSGTFATSTWERLGTTWTLMQSSSPIAVPQAGGCYDEVLGAVVASGIDFDAQTRTWSWDGTTWIARSDLQGPPIQAGASLAPCPLRQSLVRFGVGLAFQQNRATWEFVGGLWRTVPTTAVPPVDLAWPALATEPAGTVLLFGGSSAGVATNTTWRFTGTDWQALTPTTAPPARTQHGMTVAPAQGGVLLFGGLGASGAPLGDTWLWNGATWSQLAPAQSPSPRANAAMAFDPGVGEVLLFGGGAWNGTTLGDFWRWTGNNWQPIPAVGGPTSRARAVMAFDPTRQRTIVTGGFDLQPGGSLGTFGTWEWDGASWTTVGGTQPPANAGAIGAYDSVTARVVVHTAGLGPIGTWHLGASSVAAAAAYGGGCAGSSGEPTLRALGLPRQGNPLFALQAMSLRPLAPVVFGLGAQAANVPLAAGCTLLVTAPLLALTSADDAGRAQLALPLPATSALHGAAFATQAAGLDPLGPFASFAWTSGLAVTID